MAILEALLNTAQLAARAAGEEARRWYQKGVEPHDKGFREWVTEADVAAQEAALTVIKQRYPDHAFLAEEDMAADRSTAGITWIIDPLDGTTNFVRHVPFFCASVSAALDGQPRVGAVYDAIGGEMYSGAQGQGASIDEEPLLVGETSRLTEAIIGFDSPRAEVVRARQWAIMSALAARCKTVKSLGSAALGIAYVAASKFDAYLHLDLSPWDMAAGAVLVGEAGGVTRQVSGDEWVLGKSSIVVSNPELMQPILELIRGVAGS